MFEKNLTFLSGSGTTAVAAIKTNRIYMCCEPSDEYFQKGYDRCMNEKSLKKT